jgi:hypothetical protein
LTTTPRVLAPAIGDGLSLDPTACPEGAFWGVIPRSDEFAHRLDSPARVVRRDALRREHSMPKMVITHGVAAVDTWLGFKAERAEAIAGLGGSDVVDHVAHDGSNMVAVSANVADADAMMAALGSPPPEVAAAMERHGVLPPLVAYVEA